MTRTSRPIAQMIESAAASDALDVGSVDLPRLYTCREGVSSTRREDWHISATRGGRFFAQGNCMQLGQPLDRRLPEDDKMAA